MLYFWLFQSCMLWGTTIDWKQAKLEVPSSSGFRAGCDHSPAFGHPKFAMLYIAVQFKHFISDLFRVACCGGPQSIENKPNWRFIAPANFDQDATVRQLRISSPTLVRSYFTAKIWWVDLYLQVLDFFQTIMKLLTKFGWILILCSMVFSNFKTAMFMLALVKWMLYIAVQSKCCISDFFRVACCGGPQSMESKPIRRFLAPAVFQQDSTIRRPSAHPKCPMLYIAVQSKCCISDFF